MAVKPQEQDVQGFDIAKMYLWVKGLEGKVNNLLREMDVLKNDFVKKNMQMRNDLKEFNAELLEVKRNQDKMLQKMDLVIKELQNTAGVEDMMTLKKYVEYWNPMNFMTQRDVERVVEAKMALLRHQSASHEVKVEKHK